MPFKKILKNTSPTRLEWKKKLCAAHDPILLEKNYFPLSVDPASKAHRNLKPVFRRSFFDERNE